MNNKHDSLFKKLVLTIGLTIGLLQLSAQTVTIPIETENNVMLLQTDRNNVLRTIYVGKPLLTVSEYDKVSTVNHLDADTYSSSLFSEFTSRL